MVKAGSLSELQAALRGQARALGFVACGFTGAGDDPSRKAHLEEWLREGRHGSMDWMESRKLQRSSPQGLWPEARSVIALGMSYAPDVDPLALEGDDEKARISVYAQGRDYHDVVKKALKALARRRALWHQHPARLLRRVRERSAPHRPNVGMSHEPLL